jgi:exosortase
MLSPLSARPDQRVQHIGFVLTLLAVAIVGAQTVLALVAVGTIDRTASHVVMVPFVVAALIFQNRASIFESVRTALPTGAMVVLAGLGLALLGNVRGVESDTLSLRTAGLVIASIGAFLSWYGPAAAYRAMFPLSFLAFTIPPPAGVVEWMTLALKSGSAEVVSGLFSLTATPFNREGYLFALPGVAIEIADECSGIRSSIALLLTSLLGGYVLLDKPWGRTLLVLLVLPFAVLKNGIRIVGLTLLALRVDPSFLTGQLHHEGGIVFFLLTLAMMAPVVAALRKLESKSSNA